MFLSMFLARVWLNTAMRRSSPQSGDAHPAAPTESFTAVRTGSTGSIKSDWSSLNVIVNVHPMEMGLSLQTFSMGSPPEGCV